MAFLVVSHERDDNGEHTTQCRETTEENAIATALRWLTHRAPVISRASDRIVIQEPFHINRITILQYLTMTPPRVTTGTNIFDALIDILQIIDVQTDNGLGDPNLKFHLALNKVRKPVSDLVNEMRQVGMSGVKYG